MASVQEPRSSAVATSNKEKVAVDGTLKLAEGVLKKNAKNVELLEKVVVGGAMMNADELEIKVYKTHDFAGKFTVKPSANLDKGSVGEFVHQGERFPSPLPPPNAQSMFYGSSGAIVYGNYVLAGGANNTNPVRGWLLAWFVLDNEHHVYVEAGFLDKMLNLSMDEVRTKLEKSGTTSYFFDRITGAEASATLTPHGNTAALGSVFGVKRFLEFLP